MTVSPANRTYRRKRNRALDRRLTGKNQLVFCWHVKEKEKAKASTYFFNRRRRIFSLFGPFALQTLHSSKVILGTECEKRKKNVGQTPIVFVRRNLVISLLLHDLRLRRIID